MHEFLYDFSMQGMSAISEIQNASLRPDRVLHSHTDLSGVGGGQGGPPNSSIRYPRNSTPERRRTKTFKHSR